MQKAVVRHNVISALHLIVAYRLANFGVTDFQKVIGIIGRGGRYPVINLLRENFFATLAGEVGILFGNGNVAAFDVVRQILKMIIRKNKSVRKSNAADIYRNVGSSGGF